MIKNFIFFYIVSIILFRLLSYIPNKILDVSMTTKKDISLTKLFSKIKIQDFIYHEKIYILSKDQKIYIYDPYSQKIENTYQIKGLTNGKKISIHMHTEIGKQYSPLYLVILAKNNIFLADLEQAIDNKIETKKIFFDLNDAKDIYLYNEHHKNYPGKYQDILVVLQKKKGKNLLNVYDFKSQKLLESFPAEINIASYASKPIYTLSMKNISGFHLKNLNSGQRKRVYLDQIELSLNNKNFSKNIGEITTMRCGTYILPDMKNNFLWIKNEVSWLFENNKISLPKSPKKALIFEDHIPNTCNDDGVIRGEGNFKVYTLFANEDKLQCFDVKKSLLKSIADASEKVFWILTKPLVFLALLIGGRPG